MGGKKKGSGHMAADGEQGRVGCRGAVGDDDAGLIVQAVRRLRMLRRLKDELKTAEKEEDGKEESAAG